MIVKEYESLERAATPRDGEVLTNKWWISHPDHGILFVRLFPKDRCRYPQCNHNEAIARYMQKRCYPDHEVIFVPVVFTGRRYQ